MTGDGGMDGKGGGHGGRAAVLASIGAALGRDRTATDVEAIPEAVRKRIAHPKRHTLPAVGDDLVGRAIEQMEGVLMSVVRLQSVDDVVEAVRFWLEAEGIEGDVTVAPALGALGWPAGYGRGAASGVEAASVTPCLAAVAETGSLVFASTPETPSTLNFLPENHVVVLYENRIVRHVDDVFATVRALDPLPRALNFVTGPSRTADIEQTIEIGAHGPRRMHVLLLPAIAGKSAPE